MTVREAGRLWERASEREPDAKRRVQYAAKADSARATADLPRPEVPADDASLPSAD